MITVKDIRNLLAYSNEDTEVKLFLRDEDKKVCFWYFSIKEAQIKDDGLYIELQ